MKTTLKNKTTMKKCQNTLAKRIEEVKEKKPALSKCVYKEGYQIFSDSYVLAWLKNEDYINVPKCDDVYPDTTKIINQPYLENKITLNLDTMLAYFSITDSVYIKLNNGEIIGFWKKTFETFVALLNYQDFPAIEIQQAESKCAFVHKKKNGSKILILGLRCDACTAENMADDLVITEEQAQSNIARVEIKAL